MLKAVVVMIAVTVAAVPTFAQQRDSGDTVAVDLVKMPASPFWRAPLDEKTTPATHRGVVARPLEGFATALSVQAGRWSRTRVADASPDRIDLFVRPSLVWSAPRAAVENGRMRFKSGLPFDGSESRGERWFVAPDAPSAATPGSSFAFLAGPDPRGQARAYLRNRLLTEILSKSALGRGLSRFIDTGEGHSIAPGDPNVVLNRSKMLPFLSPKYDRPDRAVSIQLTWKF